MNAYGEGGRPISNFWQGGEGYPPIFGSHNISTGPNDNVLHHFICSKVTAIPTDLEEWLIAGLVKSQLFQLNKSKPPQNWRHFFLQVEIFGRDGYIGQIFWVTFSWKAGCNSVFKNYCLTVSGQHWWDWKRGCYYLYYYVLIDRPGVAGAVLQTASWLIN